MTDTEERDTELDPEGPRSILDPPHITDELFLSFPNSPLPVGISPQDGLPSPQPEASMAYALAPPLERETFVCMEDTSYFVLSENAEELARFDPSIVGLLPNGKYRVPVQLAYRLLLSALDESPGVDDALITERTRQLFDAERRSEPGWIYVDPARPRCRHYKRQRVEIPDDPDRSKVIRLCISRRDSGGEFISLSDTRVFSCELRDPPDAGSARDLDAIDTKLLAAAVERKQEFSVDDALNQENEMDASQGGIFSDTL